ncbi:DUF928 domain-containing protein [Phormidium sp. CCY1219]|uniref:DUF928 domain-containing protein n=1 Tax=Phormidium sp. CCY1219 TaxID=2886104 RepID=UPI002D1EFF1C|nr:DUF928 domain-containing protein [Phormidium sp. CCY1219]MEB3831323.1 DUF928 domain-containing protein [Phormidium sp. CCY1219]
MARKQCPLSLAMFGVTLVLAIAAIVTRPFTPLRIQALAGESDAPQEKPILSQLDPLDPPPNQDAPTQTAGGGTRVRYDPPLNEEAPDFRHRGINGIRGKCPVDEALPEVPLTLLIPPNRVGLSLTDTPPSFFVYVPPTAAPLAEFVLFDESETITIYETTIPLDRTGGIIRIQLPAEGISLEAGEYYKWYFSVICDPNDRAADLFASAWIKPIETNPMLRETLEKATPIQQAALYGENGIWYNTLTSLAPLVNASEEKSATAQAQWQQLLESETVKLEYLAEESLLDCCQIEN